MTKGWCRVMGMTVISLFTATLFVVRNERSGHRFPCRSCFAPTRTLRLASANLQVYDVGVTPSRCNALAARPSTVLFGPLPPPHRCRSGGALRAVDHELAVGVNGHLNRAQTMRRRRTHDRTGARVELGAVTRTHNEVGGRGIADRAPRVGTDGVVGDEAALSELEHEAGVTSLRIGEAWPIRQPAPGSPGQSESPPVPPCSESSTRGPSSSDWTPKHSAHPGEAW